MKEKNKCKECTHFGTGDNYPCNDCFQDIHFRAKDEVGEKYVDHLTKPTQSKPIEPEGGVIQKLDNLGKDVMIANIKARIESEYRKHKRIDWADIAARKITGDYFDSVGISEDKTIELMESILSKQETQDAYKLSKFREVVTDRIKYLDELAGKRDYDSYAGKVMQDEIDFLSKLID